MKHLQEYILENIIDIFEASFSSSNWSHNGSYDYPQLVINDILNDKLIILGKDDKSGFKYIKFNLSTTDKDSLSNFLKKISSHKYDELDDLLNGKYIIYDNSDCSKKSLNQNITPIWTKIFKGPYSGYMGGSQTKNKGNAFEYYFIDNINKFEDNIKSIIPYDVLIDKTLDDSQNNKRPLSFKSNGEITCGQISNNDFNIGKTVTDVTLKVIDNNKEKEIYLSLKSGNTVTFANEGIKTLFPNNYFDENSEYKLSKNAKALLNLFSIDENKFKKSFTSYVKKDTRVAKGNYEIVDITDNLKHNDIFTTFLKSVIGYGFIMVHQNTGDDIDYIDFSTNDKLEKYVNNIKSAEIKYPQNGETKRLIVNVKLELIEFNFIFRAKDGGIYPTHLLADYKFIK